jgi:hypothetical protein
MKRGVAIHTLHEHCTAATPAQPPLLLGYGLLGEEALGLAVQQLAAVQRK